MMMAPCVLSRVAVLLSCVVIVMGTNADSTTTTTTVTTTTVTTTTTTDMPWGHPWWVWLLLCILHCITCCICHALCIAGIKAYRSSSASKSRDASFFDPEKVQFEVVDVPNSPGPYGQYGPPMQAGGPRGYYGPPSAQEYYGPPSAYGPSPYY
mmetsp:Transcript_51401/g.95041  ORF Transcript_51401/g.95041 Transcript_51401/m.95041 type:complete len:153 (-) Transcript_51401:259-717(-)